MGDDCPSQVIARPTPSSHRVPPSKTVSRASTPTPRAHSASRVLISSINSVQTTATRAVSRNSSTRRVRRFENDNLFGLSLILGKNLEIDGEDPGIVPTDLGDSNFVDIMDTRNRDALDYYLSCADYGPCRDEKRTRKKRTIAYEAWMNVEKRLRNIVSESLKKSEQFAVFIDATELILIYFACNLTLPPATHIPTQLNEYLRSPIRLEECENVKKCEESFNDMEFNDKPLFDKKRSKKCLVFPLVDSSFCRLLVHAACQYHGFKSKSIEVVTLSDAASEGKFCADRSNKQRNKDIICSVQNSNRFTGHGINLRSVLSPE